MHCDVRQYFGSLKMLSTFSTFHLSCLTSLRCQIFKSFIWMYLVMFLSVFLFTTSILDVCHLHLHLYLCKMSWSSLLSSSASIPLRYLFRCLSFHVGPTRSFHRSRQHSATEENIRKSDETRIATFKVVWAIFEKP